MREEEEEMEVEWSQAFGQRILKNALQGDPAVASSSFQEKGGTIALYDQDELLAHWLKGKRGGRTKVQVEKLSSICGCFRELPEADTSFLSFFLFFFFFIKL